MSMPLAPRSRPISVAASSVASARSRHETSLNGVLEALRAQVRTIERRSGLLSSQTASGSTVLGANDPGWTFGEDALDALLGVAGLECSGLHEIKPGGALARDTSGQAATSTAFDWPDAWAAARGFALALAVRRLQADHRDWDHDAGRQQPGEGARILWCQSKAVSAEFGAPYGPGLRALGLDPQRFLMIEPGKARDTLWALEEALKSGCLAMVIGQLDAVALTPARRLALAAAQTQTPCLLLTHPHRAMTAATATRWCVGPAPCAANPLDPEAPGPTRFIARLERCRSRPASAAGVALIMEWCDAAFRFHLVARLADRAQAFDAAAAAGGSSANSSAVPYSACP